MPLHPRDFPGKRVLEWGAIIFFQLNRWVNNKCSFIPFFIFSLFLTPKVFKDFGLVLIPPLLSLPLENKAVSCWPILGSKRIQEEQVKWGLAHEWEGHSLIGFLCSRKKKCTSNNFSEQWRGNKKIHSILRCSILPIKNKGSWSCLLVNADNPCMHMCDPQPSGS